jgi:MoxR-like ATPase
MNLISEETVTAHRKLLEPFYQGVRSVLVGQNQLIDRLLMGLLTDGHLLLEGLPGLAKTLAVRTVAKLLDLKFQRIQFTPDLLPSDVIGTQIYNPRSGEFSVKQGPIFANIVLADEINRAPAKVQSALLEAMQERQVTIGETTLPLPKPFFVMATQNPIEQEGTYPLPEAQVDRFMIRVTIDYPSKTEEVDILNRVGSVDAIHELSAVLDIPTLKLLRNTVDLIHIDPRLKEYLVEIVRSTRPGVLPQLENSVQSGASPRASIALLRAVKAVAFLEGRHFVLPTDIKSVAMDVLSHRVIPSFEAEAKELKSRNIVQRILETVPTP